MPSGKFLLSSSIVARTCVGQLERVGAGRLEDRNRDRGLVVEQAAQRVLARAELDARDVLERRHAAVRRRS